MQPFKGESKKKKKTRTELLLGIYLINLNEEEEEESGTGERPPKPPRSLFILLPAAGAESERCADVPAGHIWNFLTVF